MVSERGFSFNGFLFFLLHLLHCIESCSDGELSFPLGARILVDPRMILLNIGLLISIDVALLDSPLLF